MKRVFNAFAAIRTSFAPAFLAALMAIAGALPAAQPARAESVRIVAFGDSLVAGYGLSDGDGFVPRLQEELHARGHDVQVINAGVSGDTSRGGLNRVDWMLADDPDIVLVELGANDALRGLDPADTRSNLDQILTRLAEAGVEILLSGMYAPPNLGREYEEEFNAIYPDLAEKHDVLLYPFFLEGVATDADLNQGDGLHPNAAGVDVIVETIAPYVERLLPTAGQGGDDDGVQDG